MDKTYKLDNKKVIWAMGIATVIILAIFGYVWLFSDIPIYIYIEQSRNGMTATLQNEEGISWISVFSLWLCSGISFLFLAIRLYRMIKLRNRNTEELVMSYPMSRKQLISNEIFRFGYGILLCIFAFTLSLGLLVIETIKTIQIQKKFENVLTLENGSQWTLLLCMMQLSVLLIFIAWHYLCEIVCVERMLGFSLGAIGIVIYNVLIYTDGLDMGYFAGAAITILPAIMITIIVLILAAILFAIDIKLYQKIDFSKSGWFYFEPPKYFFISCVCLLPITTVATNMDEPLPSRLGLIFLALVLILALNYLAVSEIQRKNIGKLFVESMKSIAVTGVLVFLAFHFENIQWTAESILPDLYATEEWAETYNSIEYHDAVWDKYEDERACETLRQEMKQSGQDYLIPTDIEGWTYKKGRIERIINDGVKTNKSDFYIFELQNEVGKEVQLSWQRLSTYWGIHNVYSELDDLNIIKDEEYGTFIISSFGPKDTDIGISLCHYYDDKEYYDVYYASGDISEEDLLTIMRSLK